MTGPQMVSIGFWGLVVALGLYFYVRNRSEEGVVEE